MKSTLPYFKISMKDISTKKDGQLTRVLIKKGKLQKEEFLSFMKSEFQQFIHIGTSKYNYKFYTKLTVAETDELILKMKIKYKIYLGSETKKFISNIKGEKV